MYRTCRYCGERFIPPKDYYYYCSWQCKEAEGQSDAYQRGYREGLRQAMAGRYRTEHQLFSPELWKHLLLLVHPDRYHNTPLEAISSEVTRWLLEHRPPGA